MSVPGIKDLSNVWKNIKEVDLRPIQEEALRPVKLAIVGRPGVGRHTLADQMRRDPQRPDSQTQTILSISDLNSEDWVTAAELIILMLDATSNDFRQEQALAKKWADAGKNVLAFFNKIDLLENQQIISSSMGWQMERVLYGSALDEGFVQREFVPVVLELLPERHLALGRQFPLFRMAIAQPVDPGILLCQCFLFIQHRDRGGRPDLRYPLNITDMVVLTKAQAFLVYRLGLTLGFYYPLARLPGRIWQRGRRRVCVAPNGPFADWPDPVVRYRTEGGGGLFRNLCGRARGLAVVPHRAAYLQPADARPVYAGFRERQKDRSKHGIPAAANTYRIPKLPRPRIAARLPRPRFGRRKAAQLPALSAKTCLFCGKPNAPDANLCQYCGQSFQL